jgi:2-oxo-4-hydroxy-4-carboxy-5-ureidoimidazoline decarboxylase
MTQAERLMLVRAHPDLGSKAKMADASVQEQAGAGLDRLTGEEYDRFHTLNQAYKEKFGFPFIIAVKLHTKASILEAFEQRLHHTPEAEIKQALTEITQIARLRLAALLTDT